MVERGKNECIFKVEYSCFGEFLNMGKEMKERKWGWKAHKLLDLKCDSTLVVLTIMEK